MTYLNSNKLLFILLLGLIASCSTQKINTETELTDMSNKIQTPYGFRNFNDDSVSIYLLDWFSQSTGDLIIDSVNTRIIIDVCNKSDGALSEIMGMICIQDITNKPYSIISIYKTCDSTELSNYIDAIAVELCMKQQTNVYPNQYEIFLNQFNERSHLIDDFQYLIEILAIIRERYNYYLKIL